MSQAPGPHEFSSGWFSFLKGLTLRNAAAIVILICAFIPAYVVFKLASDPALLDRFLSAYSTEPTSSPCALIRARERGEDWSFAITTGLAFEGQVRYSISAIMTHEPSKEEQQTTCLILQTLINAMHGLGPPPDIIWQYNENQGRGEGR